MTILGGDGVERIAKETFSFLKKEKVRSWCMIKVEVEYSVLGRQSQKYLGQNCFFHRWFVTLLRLGTSMIPTHTTVNGAGRQPSPAHHHDLDPRSVKNEPVRYGPRRFSRQAAHKISPLAALVIWVPASGMKGRCASSQSTTPVSCSSFRRAALFRIQIKWLRDSIALK